METQPFSIESEAGLLSLLSLFIIPVNALEVLVPATEEEGKRGGGKRVMRRGDRRVRGRKKMRQNKRSKRNRKGRNVVIKFLKKNNYN